MENKLTGEGQEPERPQSPALPATIRKRRSRSGQTRSLRGAPQHGRWVDGFVPTVGIIVVVFLLMLSAATIAPPTAASGCSGGSTSGVSPSCSGGQVTVLVQLPMKSPGVYLAGIEFNGTLLTNGTQLTPLTAGFPYIFSVVNVAAGYDFGGWEVTNGTIGNQTGSPTSVAFCVNVATACSVNLSVSVLSQTHSEFSGEVFSSGKVNSMDGTFTVPSLSWWKPPGAGNPKSGATELVNWGVALGGINSAPATEVGLQIEYQYNSTTGLYTTKYQPFWSTYLDTSTWTEQLNFSLSSGQTVSTGDTIRVSVSAPGCAGNKVQPSVLIKDWNPFTGVTKWAFNATSTCGGSPFTTSEWMVWTPPLTAKGLVGLAPSYHGGMFYNHTLNGLPIFTLQPGWTVPPGFHWPGQGIATPCRPFIGCLGNSNPHSSEVIYTQLINASGGWYEGLEVGNRSIPIALPLQFDFTPFVATFANESIDVYPSSDPNPPLPLLPVVNNQNYSLGSFLAPTVANNTLSVTQGGTVINTNGTFNIGFGIWGTDGTGVSVASGVKANTTLSVTAPNSALELLPLETGPSWSGYVEQLNKTQVNTGSESVNGEIVVPTVSANTTGTINVLGAWVGLGGYCGVDYANTPPVSTCIHGQDTGMIEVGVGIITGLYGTGSLTYEFWFHTTPTSAYPTGLSEVGWTNGSAPSFQIKPGDDLSLWVAEGSECNQTTNLWVCWNVTDTTTHSHWNNLHDWDPVVLTPADWVVDNWAFRNGSAACNASVFYGSLVPSSGCYVGLLPKFTSLSFSGLRVDNFPVYLFGPFLALNGEYLLFQGSGGRFSGITTELLATATAESFTEDESSYP
jgi:hypothetical protein